MVGIEKTSKQGEKKERNQDHLGFIRDGISKIRPLFHFLISSQLVMQFEW